ncbi:hypothetical protein DCAR_0310505 [Daucus carota subsp. sativus]|uniref:J domain-containing protein n=1 Tax=Daucus carota subsp. sativus TaxID=79200 RepID=A0AAF0WKJ8_DAUCS|nr:hypothetical protein DCAR_0310505 [Daucus carota subsp. sativus]
MEAPRVVGCAVVAAAYAGRYIILAWNAFKARPPRLRRFYGGGFQSTMTRREAALILGVRERTLTDKVREAQRRLMIANHPDAGCSHYLASKIPAFLISDGQFLMIRRVHVISLMLLYYQDSGKNNEL